MYKVNADLLAPSSDSETPSFASSSDSDEEETDWASCDTLYDFGSPVCLLQGSEAKNRRLALSFRFMLMNHQKETQRQSCSLLSLRTGSCGGCTVARA